MRYAMTSGGVGVLRAGAALMALALVAGCGGGGGTNSTPAPAPTPTPTPTPAPAPTPTPTPAAVFQTDEFRFSDGPAFHDAIAAWQLGATGKGVTIGIVDSGIDPDNPEFTGRISPLSGDVAGSRALGDSGGHGTMVALVAAAARNNNGIVGIAFDATVMALRADDPGSCESNDGCAFFDRDIAVGIDRAVQGGAKVINLSLGGSPPDSRVRAAVARAGSAGVLVVVAAGNDADEPQPAGDPTQPDPFAVGVRQAGSGNVIIAGSVTSTSVQSGFSNPAGADAQFYLNALGDRVCCVYENGDLKTFTDANGDEFVYVSSGTSFAAPQIAGAAALLFQAFPNLTGQQVAELLLDSARDLGAPGTDATYGRGVLDIGGAFAPKGTTALASTLAPLPLGDTAVVTSEAMGDAALGASLETVVLDRYRRAYRVDLGGKVRGAREPSRLGASLTAPMRQVSGGNGQVSLAFSVDARSVLPGLPQERALALSAQDARGAQVLAAQVVARLSPRSTVAFGYAQGADGLVAQVQGADAPAFLVARAPGGETGFARGRELSFALRHDLGRWGLTVSGTRGQAISGAPLDEAQTLLDRRKRSNFARLGLSANRRFGALDAALGASWLREDRTILGARLHDSLGSAGADTLFLDARGGWHLADGWRLGAAWRQGFTRARASGIVGSGSRLATSGWAVDIARSSLFTGGDMLALRLSQPLRVSSGGLNLTLPVAYSYDTLAATTGTRRLNLAPQGRELASELAWRGPMWGGMGNASVFYRTNPGHYAARADDAGLAIGWRTDF